MARHDDRPKYADRDRHAEASHAEPDRRKPREIEDDIARNRAQLGDTLDALGAKLAPRELVGEFAQSFKGNTGDYFGNLGRQVRDNPLPTALIGAGILWLAAGDKAKSGAESLRDRVSGDDSDASGPDYGSTYEVGAVGAGGDIDAGPGIDTGPSVTEKARARARVRAASARRRAQDARGRAGDAARGAADRGREIGGQVADFVEDHPLAVGAIGLAIGALFGAALPSTRREDEALGAYRDEALSRAKDVGRDYAERGRRVAETAVESGREQARREGGDAPSSGASGAGTDGDDRSRGRDEGGFGPVGAAAARAAEDEAGRQGLRSGGDNTAPPRY